MVVANSTRLAVTSSTNMGIKNMADNEIGSLIPDPSTNSEANDLPTASIIPNEAPSAPAEDSLMNDTGSLVPDEAVTNLGNESSDAPASAEPVSTPPEKTEKPAEAAPVEKKADDDSYTVPPEPDLPVAGAIKNEEEKKEKKPVNKKLIAIIAGSVVGVAVLTLLVIFVVIPLIGNLTRGKLDNTAKSFFVREKYDEGNYAVYSEEGKPLTGFDYGSVTDFIDGYALVTDESGENFGIISAGGKMSVEYGTYSKIQRYGALYDVATSSGTHKLISGDNNTVAEYSGKVETFDNNEVVLFMKDDKYYLYNFDGKQVLEIDSSEKPEVKFEKDRPFYIVTTKKHVYIVDENTSEVKYGQATSSSMRVISYTSDAACVLLMGDDNYGITYAGKYQEIPERKDLSISMDGYSSTLDKQELIRKTDCYFYSDRNYTGSYSEGYYHPDYRLMDESFNFVAVPAYKTKEGGYSVYYMRLDPKHYMKIYNSASYSGGATAQIYSDGKLVNTIKSDSSFSTSYNYVVFDGQYHLDLYDKSDPGVKFADRYAYNIYDRDGKLVKSNKADCNVAQDTFGNRVNTSARVICDKDYNVKFEGEFSSATLRVLNGKYFMDNSDFKYIVDPESGKELIRDGVYKELSYSKQNNMYVGLREDNTTDILDSEGNVIHNFNGKATLRQNHVYTRGGSVSELYTLKGEKFYTYE